VGKRTDGYHDLCTVFQTVSLADRIMIEPADDLSLECDDPDIPTGAGNLILKAAEALRRRYRVTRGARIRLEKHIPSPGGLGGGSSNAAIALMGLRVLWDLPATVADLHPIAAGLGSDVPFFLYGGTALGTGRGTEIEQLPDIDCEIPAINRSGRSRFHCGSLCRPTPRALDKRRCESYSSQLPFWDGRAPRKRYSDRERF
jgi:4-diphosphocytidyl-2-C-methyl-D-erythritol kinase